MLNLQRKLDPEQVAILTVCTANKKHTVMNTFYRPGQHLSPSFFALYDGARAKKLFRGRGVPNTFIVDQQGLVRFRHRGFNKELGKIIEMEIARLLGAKKLSTGLSES